jgi:hypothetical protein
MSIDPDHILQVKDDRCLSSCHGFYWHTDKYGNIWQIWYKSDDFDYTVPKLYQYAPTTLYAMNILLSKFMGDAEKDALSKPLPPNFNPNNHKI